MKALIKYMVILFSVALFFASCCKEEVKPFNCHHSNDTSINNEPNRSGDDNVNNGTTSEDATGTSSDDSVGSDDEGGGITDGGTSSDYDSKGKKKTNKTN